jgi:ATP-binding cassette subfamily B protein/subfamily B ATP-binding cassette protein MsbA
MKNFGRAVRLALQRRCTLAAAVFCSLMVALCWGANIGAIYPFIQIVFRGDSLPDWVDRKIRDGEQATREIRAEIDSLRAEPARANERRKLALLEGRMQAEQTSLATMRRLRPYAHRYLPDDPFRTLLLVAAFLFAGTLVKDAFLLANSMLISRVVQWTTLQLRRRFFDHALQMDLAGFGAKRTSGLISRFANDLGGVAWGVGVVFSESVREPLKLIVCLSGAALVSWRLLLFCLVLTPLSVFLVTRLGRLVKRGNARALEESAVLFRRLSETFGGIQAVKVFTREAHERNRLEAIARRLYRQTVQLNFFAALAKPINELFGIGVACVALVASGYLVLEQQTHIFGIKMSDRPLDFGAVSLFFGFLIGASDPARKLSVVFQSLHAAAAAADRFYPLLDERPKIADPPAPLPAPDRRCELVFDKVSFGYLPEQLVLQDVELRVPFGETLAIVGPNGCGKSTLLSLIPRFYDPTSGAVRLAFADLRDLRLADVRGRIGMVTQHTLLFDDSVFDNIRYGLPEATREQVIEAAKKAHAHEFIMRALDRGYDTIVGEQGGRLSGGQRQRIALARAILRDPAILLLDEATSQIDPESEQLIHDALREFVRGRTTILVTHRMSTLALADRILVMDQGRVADLGSHVELLARCDLYRRLQQGELRRSA